MQGRAAALLSQLQVALDVETWQAARVSPEVQAIVDAFMADPTNPALPPMSSSKSPARDPTNLPNTLPTDPTAAAASASGSAGGAQAAQVPDQV